MAINTMQVDGQVQVKVTCEPLDLIEFIKRDFMPMNLMCEQAKMSEREIYDRSKAVFEYFGLPFAMQTSRLVATGVDVAATQY